MIIKKEIAGREIEITVGEDGKFRAKPFGRKEYEDDKLSSLVYEIRDAIHKSEAKRKPKPEIEFWGIIGDVGTVRKFRYKGVDLRTGDHILFVWRDGRWKESSMHRALRALKADASDNDRAEIAAASIAYTKARKRLEELVKKNSTRAGLSGYTGYDAVRRQKEQDESVANLKKAMEAKKS